MLAVRRWLHILDMFILLCVCVNTYRRFIRTDCLHSVVKCFVPWRFRQQVSSKACCLTDYNLSCPVISAQCSVTLHTTGSYWQMSRAPDCEPLFSPTLCNFLSRVSGNSTDRPLSLGDMYQGGLLYTEFVWAAWPAGRGDYNVIVI